MADFTTTTNLSLKKPAIGGSSDKWGEYLNSDLDTIDTEIQSLKTASTSRSLESLSNVLDTTPTTGQLLQYDTANWKAATVTIPEDIEDLGNVTVSSPADGEVLAWSASNARWENQSAGVATIPAGSITTAKLSPSLQGQVNLILQTTGTPTDDQILRYNATTANWEFQDLPGGTVSALSDTDVSGISNQDVLVYNSTSGDWVSRPLAIADVVGLQASLDAKLESSDLSVSSLTDTTITTTADNSVLVYDASDAKWKNEGPSTARSSLGLAIGTDVQAYDADTTKNNVSNTFTANQIISVADNTNAALRITQTGTGNALVVEDSANPDSTPFVVDASGTVVVGATSRTSQLALLEVLSFSPANVITIGRGVNNSAGARFIFLKSRSTTTLNGGTAVLNGDQLGDIRFFGDDGTNMIQGANIVAQVDGPPGTNDMPGRLVFSTTADGASSPTERMRIDSSGNVGIGTTNPNSKLNVSTNSTDAAVTITQTGSGNALVVEDETNPDSTPVVVDNAGKIIKGTTSAIVSGMISSPGASTQIHGVSTFRDASLELASWVSSVSSDANLVFSKSPSGAAGTQTLVSNGEDLGKIRFGGSDGTTVIEAANIRAEVDGTPSTNDMPGRLIFSTTADGASSPTERMRIDSSGNVGIGTSSPSQKLDVSGNINATGALTLGTALAIAEGGTGQTNAAAARIALLPTLGTAGQVLAVNTGATDVEWVNPVTGAGSGTVISVAISGTDGIEVDSGSPVTTSGTIALGINAATLSSHLSLGTAATTAATDYATAAQGTLADSAVQPGDDASTLGSGAAADGYVLTADGAGGAAWEAASGGGGGTTAYVEHSDTISDSFTVASGSNRMYIGGTTFSGTISVAGRLAIVAGPANFTGTINVTGTLATV